MKGETPKERLVRVTGDRDTCAEAGLCALVAPQVFDQGEDGLVVVLDERPQGPARDAAAEAAALCPSRAARVLQE